MNHFAEIRERLDEYGIDAMLLTCEANRFYASGFHSSGTDGAALVTKERTYYWTDSRYIEAARQQVCSAAVEMTTADHGYTAFLNEAVERHGIHTIGFEETYMTVAELENYRKKVKAEFKGAAKLLEKLRMVKTPEELEALVGAQRIAERALSEICNDIKVGVTEKEIAAKLTYLMLRYGAENMSFDPIVASGANGSKPHAVPTDKPIAAGGIRHDGFRLYLSRLLLRYDAHRRGGTRERGDGQGLPHRAGRSESGHRRGKGGRPGL